MKYEILHFSVRPRFCGKSGFQPTKDTFEVPYAIVNIVFRAMPDEDDEMPNNWIKHSSSEYQEVWAAESIEAIEDYDNNTVTEFEPIKDDELFGRVVFKHMDGRSYEDIFKKGYTRKPYTLIRHIEKFDVYRYGEYIEWNPATIGILQTIEQIKNNYSGSQFTDACLFERCMEALDKFWH